MLGVRVIVLQRSVGVLFTKLICANLCNGDTSNNRSLSRFRSFDDSK